MHKQAALNTAKVLGIGILVGLATVFGIELLTLDIVLKLLGVGFLVYFVYMFYSIEKGRLESQERLNNMSK